MEPIIRLATTADARKLSRLNQAFNGGGPLPTAYIEAAMVRSSEVVAVAEAGGVLYGFACAQVFWSFCYTTPQGEITELYVEPEFRRRGISRALLAFLENQLRDRGVRNLMVLTGQANETAQQAYQASEYELDDVAVLRKTLEGAATEPVSPPRNANRRAILLAEYIKSLPDFEFIDGAANYDHIGAIIVDGILQAGINYDNVVRPRAERIERDYPEAATTDGFINLLARMDAETLINFRGKKIDRLHSAVQFFKQENIQTKTELRRFLEVPDNRQRFRSIKGVGDKTRDYFCLLAGIPTVAVDRHLINFLRQAGVTTNGYMDTLTVIHEAADLLGISRSMMDHSLWTRMAR